MPCIALCNQLARASPSSIFRLQIGVVSPRCSVHSSRLRWTKTFAQTSQRYATGKRRGIAHFDRGAISPSSPASRLTYAIIAAGCLAALTLSASEPHLLESDQANDQQRTEKYLSQVTTRYSPLTFPAGLHGAEALLNWDSRSQPMQAGSNILRYDVVRIASNLNVEDYSNLATGTEDDELKWIVAGVFDGHAGWQTSEALQAHLTNYLVRHIDMVVPFETGIFSDAPSPAVDKAIKAAFVELDQDIMTDAVAALTESRYLNDAVPALEAAYAGSCAIVSYYNSDTRLLKVACTGDSRAVLGRRTAAGEWQAIPLSEDQTGHSETEIARLQREHPNEPGMIAKGRLLGLAVTRAFGDCRWKWSRELQEQARDRFFGPQLREGLLTPPYLTAEPVVTTIKIEPEKGDFLIQASDGLWDELTSSQAVDLVGRWMKSNDTTHGAPPVDQSRSEVENLLSSPPLSPTPVNPAGRRAYTTMGKIEEKDYVVRDTNAAVHLARNALGGGDEDRLCGLLTGTAPHSRNMRDDITIQVIFFGEDPNVIVT